MSLFARDLGIDLGTANTLVYVRGKGIVTVEPSVVAVNKNTGEVYAVGNEAKEMIGRTPGNIVAVRPLKDGVIADFDITQIMLKHFIKKNVSGLFKPRVVICIPSGVTEVEKRAVRDATLQAGAREVFLLEEPMAAAIGAGLPVEQPVGCMIVDIGGGTCEVAVISLGGIVTSVSIRKAGDEFDNAIVQYLKKEFNLLIGDRTAEDIKIAIGSAMEYEDEKSILVKGRDLISGLPKDIMVSPAHIREALKEPIEYIVDAVKVTLEKTPPELSADIIENGITLTGGGAYIRNLDRLIAKETGITTRLADQPFNSVVLGAGKMLDEIQLTKGLTSFKRKR